MGVEFYAHETSRLRSFLRRLPRPRAVARGAGRDLLPGPRGADQECPATQDRRMREGAGRVSRRRQVARGVRAVLGHLRLDETSRQRQAAALSLSQPAGMQAGSRGAREGALMDFSAFDTIIDPRTPSEFAEDHIPGAISAPVLGDAQRAEVGTLYKQVSPFEAKKVGAALIAKNVAVHVENLWKTKDKGWKPLVYCWRGGKRSGAMAHILREIGWEAQTLPGGYKAYRKWVVEQLSLVPEEFDFQVVHGPTGSGKSRLLAALRETGAQVLDLEVLAAHRGSVLGGLPDRSQPSQKMFESMLLNELSLLDRGKPVYVEGESKKIGQLQVPEALIARMRASPCVRLETDTEVRVTLLLQEYDFFLENRESLYAQL